MADLSESSIHHIVHDELKELSKEMSKLHDMLHRVETRFNELHSMQNELHSAVNEISKVMYQTQDIPTSNRLLERLQSAVTDLQQRLQSIEHHAGFTAGYLSSQMKDREERGLSAY